jgi:hypothetical protein
VERTVNVRPRHLDRERETGRSSAHILDQALRHDERLAANLLELVERV